MNLKYTDMAMFQCSMAKQLPIRSVALMAHPELSVLILLEPKSIFKVLTKNPQPLESKKLLALKLNKLQK
jgi:hypothetical protein